MRFLKVWTSDCQFSSEEGVVLIDASSIVAIWPQDGNVSEVETGCRCYYRPGPPSSVIEAIQALPKV